ncbi:hypothetical protein AAVH_13941 [Aphelenchoides avenae]|nr:hypothetical protein AAVH_13941 [Aphelenchus avenae]
MYKLAVVLVVALVAHETYACIGMGGCGCGPQLPQIPMKQISLCVPDIQFCPPQIQLPSCGGGGGGCGCGRKKREAIMNIRARRLAKLAGRA